MWPSVTEVVCTCNFLQRAADDPDLPIQYDAGLNEFYFVYSTTGGKGKLSFHHCSFCGGKAPESKRDALFARIPLAEQHRLFEMAQSLHSVEEVLAALGEPDEDVPYGMMDELPEKDGQPGTVRVYRVLHYHSLSETADVAFTVDSRGAVGVSLSGKYLGEEAPNKALLPTPPTAFP